MTVIGVFSAVALDQIHAALSFFARLIAEVSVAAASFPFIRTTRGVGHFVRRGSLVDAFSRLRKCMPPRLGSPTQDLIPVHNATDEPVPPSHSKNALGTLSRPVGCLSVVYGLASKTAASQNDRHNRRLEN